MDSMLLVKILFVIAVFLIYLAPDVPADGHTKPRLRVVPKRGKKGWHDRDGWRK